MIWSGMSRDRDARVRAALLMISLVWAKPAHADPPLVADAAIGVGAGQFVRSHNPLQTTGAGVLAGHVDAGFRVARRIVIGARIDAQSSLMSTGDSYAYIDGSRGSATAVFMTYGLGIMARFDVSNSFWLAPAVTYKHVWYAQPGPPSIPPLGTGTEPGPYMGVISDGLGYHLTGGLDLIHDRDARFGAFVEIARSSDWVFDSTSNRQELYSAVVGVAWRTR